MILHEQYELFAETQTYKLVWRNVSEERLCASLSKNDWFKIQTVKNEEPDDFLGK